MRGIASLKFLAGFCYTQLTDIEQETNGLLTYDRKPKYRSKLWPNCIAICLILRVCAEISTS